MGIGTPVESSLRECVIKILVYSTSYTYTYMYFKLNNKCACRKTNVTKLSLLLTSSKISKNLDY